MRLCTNYISLVHRFGSILLEIFILIITIIILIILIKDKKGDKYNINIVFIGIADIFLILLIDMFKGLSLIIALCIASILLKLVYDKGIDEINVYEMRGISFKDKNREELLTNYNLMHNEEEIKNIKLRAKQSRNYRMSICQYVIAIYVIPCIYFILKMLFR